MKLNQDGGINGAVIALVFVILLLIGASSFAFWAYSGRQNYKNNADQLISKAVGSAKQKQQSTDDASFAVAEQNPLTQYIGPQAYGTISLYYPKNWSSYVNTNSGGGYPVDGYFYPGTLPSVSDSGQVNFALRLQVENNAYATVLQTFQSAQQNGKVTIKAYSLPKLPSVVGVEVTGQLENNLTGTLIVLPLRSTALEVWTEGTGYLTEFNNDILANLSFSP
ncbi:MAG: hypothetical protein WDN66_00895 [Candidatus Saccharibacteria bacterium]